MRLALGSAQWGGQYGIANRAGQPGLDDLRGILGEAWEAGLRTIDTAQAYGDAEERLGEVAGPGWEIVTKIAPDVVDVPAVRAALEQSRRRLKRDVLDVVLLHRPDQRTLPGVWDELLRAREQGRVGAIGVSVARTDQAAGELVGLDAIQVPASILDQRLAREGFFDARSGSAVRVFVRSVFLQGAAFLGPDRLPPQLAPLAPSLERLAVAAAGHETNLAGLFLAYARDRFGATVVIGCETRQQLRDGLAGWSVPTLSAAELARLEALVDPATQCEDVLNPARW